MSLSRINIKLSSIVWILAGVFLAINIYQLSFVWSINQWSLLYFKHTTWGPGRKISLSDPPKNHPFGLVWLAQEALSNGNPTQAQALLTPMLKQNNKLALRLSGYAYQAGGNLPAAVEAWRLAGDYQSLSDTAQSLQNNGNLKDALLAYRAAQEVNPDNGTWPLVVFLSFSYDDKSEAEAVLRKALAQYPKSGQYLTWLFRLGELLSQEGKWDQAETIYHQVLLRQPNDIHTNIGLGWIYYYRGDGLESAINQFKYAISLNPTRGDGYYAIGQVLVKEKRFSDADIWFAQAVERNPAERLWWLARADTARFAGNLDLSLKIYEEMTNRFPDWSQVYYEMSWSYKMDGSMSKAVESIEKAISLMNPPNIWYYVRAAEIYESAGYLEKACKATEQALILNSTNQENLSELSQLIELCSKTSP